MQNTLETRLENTNNEQSTKYGIPIKYYKTYFSLLEELKSYYRGLIKDDIFGKYKNIPFPIGLRYIEDYLDGFKIKYLGFKINSINRNCLDGLWKLEDDNRTVIVFFNANTIPERQRYTKLHELFHFCQSIDIAFLNYIDKIILENKLPIELVQKLVDKASDKAVAMYLMPEEEVIKKSEETQDVRELADYFEVSAQSILYRLKECGQIEFY